MWTESRKSLVQSAMQALNTIPINSSQVYSECYFAYRVITYLGKEIAIHGTPSQKEHILHLMKLVSYEWDENNQVFSSDNRSGYLHLTTSAVWSDEIADIVDETFQIRAEINMTPLLDRMTYELIFDVAPAIILYGNEELLDRLSTFIDECS
jgi:hypothetical protein